MHSIILVFEKPVPLDQQNTKTWHGLASSLRKMCNNNKDIQMLGENCLLIPIESNLDIFHEALNNPQTFGIFYKYAILCEDIQWHVPKRSSSQDENNI